MTTSQLLLPIAHTASSQQAIHAKISAQPATPGPGYKAIAVDFSTSASDCFAQLDLITSSWKTAQRSLRIEEAAIWQQYSGSFPKAGMMRSGRLYQRVQWVHHTCGNDCSSWPTPTASMWKAWPFSKNTKNRYKESTINRALAYGQPQPHLQEWLMGFPQEWSE